MNHPSEIRFAPHLNEFHPSTIILTYGTGRVNKDAKDVKENFEFSVLSF